MTKRATTLEVSVVSRGVRRGQYLAIRVTGAMLAVLALGHYGLTHIVNDVAETNSDFIAERWSSALWITWDGLLLGTALLHALAGMTTVIRDHRADAFSRRRWIAAATGLSVVLLIIGVTALTYSVIGRI